MENTDIQLALDKYDEALNKVFQDGDIITGYSQGCIFTVMLASKLEKTKKIDKIILLDGDLKFKEPNKHTREEVIELINWAISEDFDLEELSPEPLETFTEKIIATSIVNSTWDFEPVTIDSPVLYIGTDPTEDNLYNIAPHAEFIYVEADHISLIRNDVHKIIKYLK